MKVNAGQLFLVGTEAVVLGGVFQHQIDAQKRRKELNDVRKLFLLMAISFVSQGFSNIWPCICIRFGRTKRSFFISGLTSSSVDGEYREMCALMKTCSELFVTTRVPDTEAQLYI